MKKYLLLLLFFVSVSGISQTINDYKYALVPAKFNFLKENDKFRLNTLTKMFMEKYGFTAYFDTDNIPMEVTNTNCNKVYVDVTDNSGLLLTKIVVTIKDCKGIVFFTSEGKSREKEYKIAYNEALRDAFKAFDKVNYKYNGGKPETMSVAATEKPKAANNPVSVQTVEPIMSKDQLFAQPISNGFQLVDDTPKIVLKLTKTSQPNYFMAAAENKQGVVYSKNGEWYFDYYKDEKLISEKLNIKF